MDKKLIRDQNIPIYGTYVNHKSRKTPLSKVNVSFTPIDFIAHWQRCSITANYLANFQSHNFEDSEKIINALSTVLNELIENAIKFSIEPYEEITLSILNFAKTIKIECMNKTSLKQANEFKKRIPDLIDNDPEETFMTLLMNAANSADATSGLGLITIRKNFQSKIGVKIVPDIDRSLYNVYVQIILDTEILDKL